jgi:hypothetical protein
VGLPWRALRPAFLLVRLWCLFTTMLFPPPFPPFALWGAGSL